MKKKIAGVLAMACLLAAFGMSVQAKSKGKGVLTGQVNINEANIAQLTMLPGVGVARAKLIQEYAKAHPFKTADELNNVHGVGDKAMQKLKPFVTVSGPTTAQLAKVEQAAQK